MTRLIYANSNSNRKRRNMQNAFAGYNHNLVIEESQFYDMKNLTSDYYPVMSPRDKRGIIDSFSNPQGLFGGDKLAWVDEGRFYYDGNLICEVSDTEKQFVRIGALLCIFPDKIIYNTYTGELDSMEVSVHTSSETTFSLCQLDGTAYDMYVSGTEPDPEEHPVWLDTSTSPNVLKEYAATSAQWVEIATSYIKISNPDIGTYFSEYDAVTITDCDIASLNTDNIVYGAGDGYIIVAGLIDKVITQTTGMYLKRLVPDMDFVTELDNRIWGCSSDNHEIYACKLGDPKNWRCYMGLTSDSYTATIGVEGKFTGAISHLGYILFFKENAIIKVYGNDPSSYIITTTRCRGVQEGSEKSLVTINEILYYKAVNSICCYDGSLPQNISLDLGNSLYFDARAGYCKEKYYVCMRDSNYNWKTFVYDTIKGMWHVEDTEELKWFANVSGGLYFIDKNNALLVANMDALVNTIFPGMPDEEYMYPSEEIYPNQNYSYSQEGHVEWEAETGDIGMDSPDRKYISGIMLRLVIENQAQLQVYVQYDSDGVWQEVINLQSTSKRTVNVPIPIKRCDHARLRLKGIGECRLYSITKTIEEGSHVND